MKKKIKKFSLLRGIVLLKNSKTKTDKTIGKINARFGSLVLKYCSRVGHTVIGMKLAT